MSCVGIQRRRRDHATVLNRNQSLTLDRPMTSLAHHTDRTDSDSIDVYTRAQTAILTIAERVQHPHRGMTSRLAVAMRDIVTMAKNYGVNEAEARLIPVCIDGLIDDLYNPLTEEAVRVAARIESDRDRAEDAVQDLRQIEGDSAQLLDEHAKRLEQQAAASRTLARHLRARARQIKATGAMARQRLNLPAR